MSFFRNDFFIQALLVASNSGGLPARTAELSLRETDKEELLKKAEEVKKLSRKSFEEKASEKENYLADGLREEWWDSSADIRAANGYAFFLSSFLSTLFASFTNFLTRSLGA